MGWARGSYLAEEMWESIGKSVKPEAREKVARTIISLFSDNDADDWNYGHKLFKDAGYRQIEKDEIVYLVDARGREVKGF